MTEKLILKPINELLGEHFYIPYYQRGYRWTEHQVNDLLNDIWSFAQKDKSNDKEFYCLQPIVVKKKSWVENEQTLEGFEVIDGQQRLTTLFIILSYLTKEFLKVESLIEDYGKETYSLRYQTRPNSEIFLKNIKEDTSNIDYYHIWNAYLTVQDWFTNGKNVKDRTDKNKFLSTLLGKKSDEKSVQIIWYIVEEAANSIELFTRLNIGKIPLTNAELIKALFLASSSFQNETHDESIRKKLEISQFWDLMEQQLNDDFFWSFITNVKKDEYATKIELIFDIIAKKEKNEIDPLYTFLYFLEKSKNKEVSLWKLWIKIEQYYSTLQEWFKDRNLYHKIGYLISIGENIRELIELSVKSKKGNFEQELEKRIKASINSDIEKLSYDKSSDYNKIERVLTLFNIESIRTNNNITEFYPFKFHKSIQWSLEHIHAQNSESLDRTKKEPWHKWLNYHEKLILEIAEDQSETDKNEDWNAILEEIKLYNNEKLTWGLFEQLSQKIIAKFSKEDEEGTNDLHGISNLALLSQPDNAALNNAVFEVKRREIINMDKKGNYIPICTRRVFLKYYNNKPSTQQYYFWGKDDREMYFNEIKLVLEKYLPQEIQIEI